MPPPPFPFDQNSTATQIGPVIGTPTPQPAKPRLHALFYD